MAEDIKMNTFALATDGAYIYAEAADGSQVKIRKSDLIRTFCIATQINTADLNTLISGGVFYVNHFTNGPSGYNNYAYLENLSSGGIDIVQRLNFILTVKSFKRLRVNGSWTEWKEI